MKKFYTAKMYFYSNFIKIYATERGLSFISTKDDKDELSQFFQEEVNVEEDEAYLTTYLRELRQYFNGTREAFDLRLDMDYSYTKFQQQVWAELLNIPYGETRTYSEIAESIGKPSAVRAVSTAIAKNPLLVIIPCHRVIGTDGQLRGYRGGNEMKKRLLSFESAKK